MRRLNAVQPADPPSAVSAGLEPFGKQTSNMLETGLRLLGLFTADRTSLSFVDLAAATGLPSPVLTEALEVLCRHGMLTRDRGAYTAGIKTLELAYACQCELPLVQVADPILRSIRDELDESTMLAVRWRDYRVNVAQAESHHPFRQSIPLGKLKPLYIGAGGKVLLSGLSDAEIDAYLERVTLERMSPTTTTDRKALVEAVHAIRESGFAETFSERNHGGASFAAAVRGVDGGVMGALVISVPLYRYSLELRDSIAQFLVSGADEISERHARHGAKTLPH